MAPACRPRLRRTDGRAVGTNNAFGDIGGGFGPVVALPLVDAVGFSPVYFVCGAPVVAALILVAGVRRGDRSFLRASAPDECPRAPPDETFCGSARNPPHGRGAPRESAIHNAGHYHAAHDAWEDEWLELRRRLRRATAPRSHPVHGGHPPRPNRTGRAPWASARAAPATLADLPADYRSVNVGAVRAYVDALGRDPSTSSGRPPAPRTRRRRARATRPRRAGRDSRGSRRRGTGATTKRCSRTLRGTPSADWPTAS